MSKVEEKKKKKNEWKMYPFLNYKIVPLTYLEYCTVLYVRTYSVVQYREWSQEVCLASNKDMNFNFVLRAPLYGTGKNDFDCDGIEDIR